MHSHLTCKVANRCLNVRERVEVVEWNKKWSPHFSCCHESHQCPWKKTLTEKKFFWNALIEECQDEFESVDEDKLMLPPSTHVACNKRYRDKKDNVAKGKQSIQYRKQTETYITKNQHVERLEQNIIWRVLSVSRTNACTAKFENKIIANERMLN